MYYTLLGNKVSLRLPTNKVGEDVMQSVWMCACLYGVIKNFGYELFNACFRAEFSLKTVSRHVTMFVLTCHPRRMMSL